jgi:hypothetical protein
MKIIFIGGTGRCGKSVVAECLARHPDAIKLPFELRFLTDPDGLVDFYTSSLASWSPFLMDRRIRRLGRLLTILGGGPGRHKFEYIGWQLRQHLPNWDEHVSELMQWLYDFRYVGRWVGTPGNGPIYHAGPPDKETLVRVLGTFIRVIIKDFLSAHGKNIFISDDTWSVLFARELSELLPEAQFVNVYRDPRDVVSSMSRQAWCPKDLKLAAQYYMDIMEYYLKRALFGEICFERLIEHQRWQMVALCAYLEIDFRDAMLELLNKEKANIGRWKDETNQEAFEAVMPLVKELGYE